jgi:glycosyltransferase involved in cell wall biosynthesis
MDITAVLNVHREGRLLVPSLRSFQVAIQRARDAGMDIEAYIIADRADAKTLDLLNALNTGIEVVPTGYGDLGQARNAAVKIAKGRYVAFLDADDLWGGDWLVKAWAHRPTDDNFVAHPQWWVAFTTNNAQLQLVEHVGTQDPRYDPDWLVQFNPWTALCFAPRTILEDHPYQAREPGIGYEDWQFNCNTVAEGVQHVAIPGSIHFIRQGKGVAGSLCEGLRAAGTVPGMLPYFERRPGLPRATEDMVQSTLDAQWFARCVIEANACEPRLWPLPGPLRTWVTPKPTCAETLWLLQECPGKDANVLIVLPDVGGQLFSAAVDLVKQWEAEDRHRVMSRVTFLVTTAAPNKGNIHAMETAVPGCNIIFLSALWKNRTASEKLFIMQRFLTQNIPENVLCLDDPWLAAVLQINAKAVKNYSNVWYYAGVPRFEGGRPVSPGLQHLPEIFDDLHRVVCETTDVKDGLVSTYGFPADRLETIA